MTDKEIIKALECCANSDNNGFARCDKCPKFEGGEGCTLRLMSESLDLINRLKAENERLEYDNVHWNDWEVKCRAIVEFAERLKEQFSGNKYILPSVNVSIDNLVKEMTDEGKE